MNEKTVTHIGKTAKNIPLSLIHSTQLKFIVYSHKTRASTKATALNEKPRLDLNMPHLDISIRLLWISFLRSNENTVSCSKRIESGLEDIGSAIKGYNSCDKISGELQRL